MKIDVYCHFLREKYLTAFWKKAPRFLEQVEARNRAVTPNVQDSGIGTRGYCTWWETQNT